MRFLRPGEPLLLDLTQCPRSLGLQVLYTLECALRLQLRNGHIPVRCEEDLAACARLARLRCPRSHQAAHGEVVRFRNAQLVQV